MGLFIYDVKNLAIILNFTQPVHEKIKTTSKYLDKSGKTDYQVILLLFYQ